MQSSPLYNWLRNKHVRIDILTALLRVAVGAVFLFSGFAKTIDLWGTAYKIQDYLLAWNLADLVNWPLVKIAAVALSWGEFVAGGLLLLGCYRRTVAWLLLAVMTFMLPLSAYLWGANPVADCGCFGDALVISNRATFWKNVALTAALAWLARYNARLSPWFNPYSQWIVGALLSAYAIVIGLVGFSTQPLLDFRRFPNGTNLIAVGNQADNDPEPEYRFIYERDGQRKAFTTDSLPDEADGWIFVDRELIGGDDAAPEDAFTIYDLSGNEATPEAIDSEGNEILIAVPDLGKVNPGQTYYINELNRTMRSQGGRLTVVLATDSAGVAFWRDMAMPDYELYTAEPTLLKELVRGNPGVVGLRNGIIVWKSTLSAIFDSEPDLNSSNLLKAIGDEVETDDLLRSATFTLVVLLALLLTFDRLGITLHRHLFRRRKKGKPAQ